MSPPVQVWDAAWPVEVPTHLRFIRDRNDRYVARAKFGVLNDWRQVPYEWANQMVTRHQRGEIHLVSLVDRRDRVSELPQTRPTEATRVARDSGGRQVMFAPDRNGRMLSYWRSGLYSSWRLCKYRDAEAMLVGGAVQIPPVVIGATPVVVPGVPVAQPAEVMPEVAVAPRVRRRRTQAEQPAATEAVPVTPKVRKARKNPGF